jgi:hypothetical protein
MDNIYLIVMGIKRYINGNGHTRDRLDAKALDGLLSGLNQVLINHEILWCRFGFYRDWELDGMLDQSISTPKVTSIYTI